MKPLLAPKSLLLKFVVELDLVAVVVVENFLLVLVDLVLVQVHLHLNRPHLLFLLKFLLRLLDLMVMIELVQEHLTPLCSLVVQDLQ